MGICGTHTVQHRGSEDNRALRENNRAYALRVLQPMQLRLSHLVQLRLHVRNPETQDIARVIQNQRQERGDQ